MKQICDAATVDAQCQCLLHASAVGLLSRIVQGYKTDPWS